MTDVFALLIQPAPRLPPIEIAEAVVVTGARLPATVTTS